MSLLVILVVASIDPRAARSQDTTAVQPTQPIAIPPPATGDVDLTDEPTEGHTSAADHPAEEGDLDEESPVAEPATNLPTDPNLRRDWLRKELGSLVSRHPRLAGARIGVAAVDLATGEMLYSRDSDGAYNLASNTKLITTATALATLGPGYTFPTNVMVAPRAFDRYTGIVKGDLYLRGHGDPTLTHNDLERLAHDLAVAGVRQVTGKLMLDASYFDSDNEPPHFSEQPKERAGFRTPISAVALDGNTTIAIVESNPTGAGLATVRLEPAAPDYVRLVRSEVLTVSSGPSRVWVASTLRGDHIEISVTGQLNVSDGIYYTTRRIDDPERFTGEVFRRILTSAGIRLGSKVVGRAATPQGARVIASHRSDQLSTIVRLMNKYSNNFIAETLYKVIGAEQKLAPAATWADGASAISAHLSECGLKAGSFRVENGSGLFGSTAVSPSQLVSVLRCAQRNFRIAPEFIASLPIAGVDGTLSRRLGGDIARGRVRAKTGTLNNVTTLAGFAGADSQHLVAFAVLVNDVASAARGDARALQDEIAATLTAFISNEASAPP